MFNVLLEELPNTWNGYPIDCDFRNGIRIMKCLQDEEFEQKDRIICALELLFCDERKRPNLKQAQEGLAWFMSEYNHDRKRKKSGEVKAYDFDIDQWRIYSAFLNQYGIDLNTANMHWFVFMGLFCNLDECAFTRVVDIRLRKINANDSSTVKKALAEAKQVYCIAEKAEELTEEEKARDEEALVLFNKLRLQNK